MMGEGFKWLSQNAKAMASGLPNSASFHIRILL